MYFPSDASPWMSGFSYVDVPEYTSAPRTIGVSERSARRALRMLPIVCASWDW